MKSSREGRARRAALAAALTAATLGARRADAQTDYYNIDRGRPVRIEDATPVERHAFELQAAPLRLERASGGQYRWGVEPELAWGVLPRTQLELGVPVAFADRANAAGASDWQVGVAGIELSALHQLNAETITLPAMAVSVSALVPAGPLAPASPYASATAIATRTFAWGRVHANGQVTVGPGARGAGATAGPGAQELSRWLAGVAVDHTWAVRSLLGTAEVYAREPLAAGEPLEWNAGAGTRWQLSPRLEMDAGVGRRLTGDDRGWYVTAGTAYAFGIPRMFGGR